MVDVGLLLEELLLEAVGLWLAALSAVVWIYGDTTSGLLLIALVLCAAGSWRLRRDLRPQRRRGGAVGDGVEPELAGR